ncbi:MAG TPA: hypothetical protein VJ843_03970 [Candidatus Saccharimonadales bacterium]|nr:hypothetical protein [Candidatus Saccharimonadales bacterium]
MENTSCPRHILDRHNEEHAKPGSTANQLVPGLEGVAFTEGDCALDALKYASSNELHAVMNQAQSCQELGRCILNRAAN